MLKSVFRVAVLLCRAFASKANTRVASVTIGVLVGIWLTIALIDGIVDTAQAVISSHSWEAWFS